MNLVEAIEKVRMQKQVVIVYEELIDYIGRMGAGEVDVPLPEDAGLSGESLQHVVDKLSVEIKEQKKEIQKLEGMEVAQKRKRATPGKQSSGNNKQAPRVKRKAPAK